MDKLVKSEKKEGTLKWKERLPYSLCVNGFDCAENVCTFFVEMEAPPIKKGTPWPDQSPQDGFPIV